MKITGYVLLRAKSDWLRRVLKVQHFVAVIVVFSEYSRDVASLPHVSGAHVVELPSSSASSNSCSH